MEQTAARLTLRGRPVMTINASSPSPSTDLTAWAAFRALLPYLRQFKGRVALALALLLLAKVANVGVPLVLKEVVDALNLPHALLVLPLLLLVGYGVLRLASSALGELRDAIFAKVTQHVTRRIALSVFQHLHALSLRFH
ncbi:MAG: ABC transporter transmembrane domain-containing protein, partial [Burkholderiales bacterium]